MYLQLKQTIYYFEKIIEPNNYYFDLVNYQFVSMEKRQEMINIDTYQPDDFLYVSQLDRNDIVIDFLNKHNEKRLIRGVSTDDLFHVFHWFIEENMLLDEWKEFEKQKLLEFAVSWCEKNCVKYTRK